MGKKEENPFSDFKTETVRGPIKERKGRESIFKDTKKPDNSITFYDALKKLKIEKYCDRILKSNSKGELIHTQYYFMLSDHIDSRDVSEFSKWFDKMVEFAEKNWKRPESVFQHVPRLLYEAMS